MKRRDLLRGALAVLCCDTAEIPAAAIRYESGSIFIDLKLAPELNRKHGAGRIATGELNLIVGRR